MSNLPKRVKSGLKRKCAELLMLLLPSHGRREVFLTTLFIKVANLSPEHGDMIQVVNERLKSLYGSDARTIPYPLQNIFWQDGFGLTLSTKNSFDEDDIVSVSERIIAKIPRGQWYASYEEMLNDISFVIQRGLEERQA